VKRRAYLRCRRCGHHRYDQECCSFCKTNPSPIRVRAIAYVRKHPGLTAWAIAKGIGEKASSVSSILLRADHGDDPIIRAQDGPRNAWTYYFHQDEL
jgi:ribosomal protein L37E